MQLRFILRQARRFKTSGPAQQALEFKLNRLTLDASRDASTDDVRPGELWWWAEGDNTEGDAEAYGDSESLGPDPGEVRRRFPHASLSRLPVSIVGSDPEVRRRFPHACSDSRLPRVIRSVL